MADTAATASESTRGAGASSAAWLLGAVFGGVVFVLLSDASPMWIGLLFLAICGGAAFFWVADRMRAMAVLFAFVLPIDLSKTLIAQGGFHTPGLSLTLSDLPLLGMVAAWVIDKWCRRDARIFPRCGWLPAAVIAWYWLGAFYSEDPLAGALICITQTKYYVMYLVLVDLITRRGLLPDMLKAISLSFSLQVLYAGAQVLTGSSLEFQGAKATHLGVDIVFEGGGGSAHRPSGLLHHPNVLADYLVFILPTALALVFLGKDLLGRTRWTTSAAILAAGGITLVLTLSRGGWISFCAAVLFLGVVGLRRGLIRSKHIALAATVGGLGLVALGAIYPQAYLRVVSSDSRSTESRLVMIDQASLIIGRNPVLGVGTGGYNRAAQTNIPESFSYVNPYFQDQIQKGVVHTWYLLMAAEHGVIGVLLMIALLLRHIRLIWPLSRWPDPASFALALGLAASLVGQLAFYSFDHFYGDVRIQMAWVAMALLQGLHLRASRNEGRPLVWPLTPLSTRQQRRPWS